MARGVRSVNALPVTSETHFFDSRVQTYQTMVIKYSISLFDRIKRKAQNYVTLIKEKRMNRLTKVLKFL